MNRTHLSTHNSSLLLFFFFLAIFALPAAWAQQGTGAKFGARDPRTCSSKNDPSKGAPTGEQLKQHFICDEEKVTQSIASGEVLHLLTGVTMEVAKGRPFNPVTDSWPDIDTSQTVYPIRGSYTAWQCGAIGQRGNAAGHNCNKLEQPHAKGICYKDTFGDWHCKFSDNDQTAVTNACPGSGGATACLLPAPKGN